MCRFSFAALILVLAACSAPIVRAATQTPTAALSSLSQQLTLTSLHISETNETPPFSIESQTPQLTGSDDPRVEAFNGYVDNLVTNDVDTFRTEFQQNAYTPIAGGSFLKVTYVLVSQMAEIWSIKLDLSFYYDGAAHPGSYSITVNYDLGQGRELDLGDLFLPESNYLQAISDYCIKNLKERYTEDALFLDGAAPTRKNYNHWNITPQGLQITFDEYQVAPYAAGAQSVTVPWSELRDMFNPEVVPVELLQS